MGHKSNPIGLRLNTTQTWSSRWFSHRQFSKFLRHDIELRSYLKKKLKEAQVAKVEIERTNRWLKVTIHAAKPGVIIGRGGVGAEDLKKEMKKKFLSDAHQDLQLNIQEIPHPSLSAAVVVQTIAGDIERRTAFRRLLKQSVERVQKAGAKGVKIVISGRLDGAEIARTETLAWGSVPLHTLRANIDYFRGAAFTTYGAVGIKVWIYKGQVFEKKVETLTN